MLAVRGKHAERSAVGRRSRSYSALEGTKQITDVLARALLQHLYNRLQAVVEGK